MLVIWQNWEYDTASCYSSVLFAVLWKEDGLWWRSCSNELQITMGLIRVNRHLIWEGLSSTGGVSGLLCYTQITPNVTVFPIFSFTKLLYWLYIWLYSINGCHWCPLLELSVSSTKSTWKEWPLLRIPLALDWSYLSFRALRETSYCASPGTMLIGDCRGPSAMGKFFTHLSGPGTYS